VNERRDDTTKPEAESRPPRERGSYYYDDATGYEPYSPDGDGDAAEGAGPDPLEGELPRGDAGGAGRGDGAAAAACLDV